LPHECHARETIERIERRGKEDNLPELRRFAAISGYWVEMSHLRSTPAASRVHALEEVMNSANAYDAGCLAELKAWSAMVNGDGTAGLRHAQEAVASFDQAGSCWHRIFGRAVLGWAYAETKDFGNARRWVEEARSLAEQTNLHVLDAQFDQIDALLAEARGEPLQKLIEKFLTGSSAYGTGLPLRFFPSVAPRLCALALRMNIEPAYARALIRTWRWRSEDPTDEKWPWPIRLYTLGGFELHVRDEP